MLSLQNGEFSYNHNGLRTQKKVTTKTVVNNAEQTTVETTDYTLHGKLITHLTKRTVVNGGIPTTEEMHFFYDAQSRPAMVEYNGEIYTYRHNLQGDIIGIVDNTGRLVVRYGYDAWGKPTEVWSEDDPALESTLKTAYETICMLNPFRYRGYVWDSETGLYYLRSRYYNPGWGRFINADQELGHYAKLRRNNVFAYCGNRAISCVDANGNSFISKISKVCETLTKIRFNFYYAKDPKTGKINGHMDFTNLKNNLTYSFSGAGWSRRDANEQVVFIRENNFRYFYHDFQVSEENLRISQEYFKVYADEAVYDIENNPCYRQTTLYLGLAGVQYEAELGITVEDWNGIIAPDDFYVRYAEKMTEVDTSEESGALERLFGVESVMD